MMGLNVVPFPGSNDRAWRHVADQVRPLILARTGSPSIADAVEARCRESFGNCVPEILIRAGDTREDISDTMHQMIGKFVGELCLLAEELELEKRR